MLIVHVMLVPPQLRIMLLLELNLVKEVGNSSVYSQRGQKIKESRDCIPKDTSRFLGILDSTPWKKIRKIFSPSQLMRGEIWLCKKVCQGSMVYMHNALVIM